MVFHKSWLLNLWILRPALLHLDYSEGNSAEPNEEKHNAKDFFAHADLSKQLTLRAIPTIRRGSSPLAKARQGGTSQGIRDMDENLSISTLNNR